MRPAVDALMDQLARESKSHVKAVERIAELRQQTRLVIAEARHRRACIEDLSVAIGQLSADGGETA